MAPFVTSSDLSRLGAKLSTSPTYVYFKPVSSFQPSVITFGQRESPSFISGGSMREGLCFCPKVLTRLICQRGYLKKSMP